MLLWLHREAVGPYMQTMHFCFALGAFASPLVLEGLGSGAYATAFIIFGCACMVVVPALALLVSPVAPPSASGDNDHQHHPNTRGLPSPPRVHQEWMLVLSAAATLFVYVGLETGFGGYLVTFVVRGPLQQSESTGQAMSSAYWGAIAFGRFLSIFASTRFSPSQMLWTSTTMSLAAMLVMVLLHSSLVAMWAGSMAFGVGMACIFPTVIALAETYMRVHGKHATVFVVGASIGEMVIPLSVAEAFDPVGPMSFLVILCVGCVCQLAALRVMTSRGASLVQDSSSCAADQPVVELVEAASNQSDPIRIPSAV